jgi:hypothetical protein
MHVVHVLLFPFLLYAVVLEKFKDKAAVVGKAAAEALDAMARYSFSLVDVAEVRKGLKTAPAVQHAACFRLRPRSVSCASAAPACLLSMVAASVQYM